MLTCLPPPNWSERKEFESAFALLIDKVEADSLGIVIRPNVDRASLANSSKSPSLAKVCAATFDDNSTAVSIPISQNRIQYAFLRMRRAAELNFDSKSRIAHLLCQDSTSRTPSHESCRSSEAHHAILVFGWIPSCPADWCKLVADGSITQDLPTPPAPRPLTSIT